MIDLHLHTTASDGRCSPQELVDRAATAGITVIAVTDHDTIDAVAQARALAQSRGIEVVTGIEITAVENGRDVHLLGYFVDCENERLTSFLVQQRTARVTRVEQIAERLARLGMPIDVTRLLTRGVGEKDRPVGRPHVARAMIDAGYVTDTNEAFDRWLATDRPAFVPRAGASPEDVIAIVHQADGLVSLAHPGQTRVDDRIARYVRAGLDALEVYHPDHDERAVAWYRELSHQRELLVTGGSDFHGDASHGWEPGAVSLPTADWQRLRAAAGHG